MFVKLCDKKLVCTHKGVQRKVGMWRNPYNPVREMEHFSALSQDGHEPFGPGVTPTMMSQWERLSGSSHRLMGITTYQGMGFIMGCRGKSFCDCTRHYGMFRGGNKGGERERSKSSPTFNYKPCLALA